MRTGRVNWARAVGALLSTGVLVASGVAWVAYRGFESGIAHGSSLPSGGGGGAQNILLVGSDSRAGATPAELQLLSTGDDGGSVNTDTMMVLHVPDGGGTPSLVSFPRDSWVNIPGYGMNKLNAAYPFAYTDARKAGADEIKAEGAGLVETAKTLGSLTGLHIDHYMQVNLLGFYRISMAIDGVPVCLLHAQNPDTDSDAYGRGYSGIDLPAGISTIKGKQALAFVRQRHGLPNGDLDRIKRQQYFLQSAFHTVTSAGVLLNPFKLKSLLDAVGSSLLTDPGLDLISLAKELASLASGQVTVTTIPNKGPATIYPNGVETSIVQVDTAAMPAFVAQLDGSAQKAYAAAQAASPKDVAVDVLNGTDVEGLAATNAANLKARGFLGGTVGSTPVTAATTIQYPLGAQAGAKALAAVVPGAVVTASSTVSRVTLVLGTDGHWPAGSKGSAPAAGSSGSAGAGSSQAAAPTGPDGLGCIN